MTGEGGAGSELEGDLFYIPYLFRFHSHEAQGVTLTLPPHDTFIVNMFYTSLCKQTYVHSIFRPVQILQYGNLLYIQGYS
jgi:hypothetical protein